VVEYPKEEAEPGSLNPSEDYKNNMRLLSEVRHNHWREELTFKQLVRALDMSQGGEGLSVLEDDTANQPKLTPENMTWGQLNSAGISALA